MLTSAKKDFSKGIRVYDIPKDSKIFCIAADGSTYVVFHRIYGMHSYCTTEKGAIVYVSTRQPLAKIGENVYELA